MAKKDKSQSKAGFIASIVILVAGMTIGFILLSIAYTGSNWIKFIVFVIYLFIVSFLIKFSVIFAKSIGKSEESK